MEVVENKTYKDQIIRYDKSIHYKNCTFVGCLFVSINAHINNIVLTLTDCISLYTKFNYNYEKIEFYNSFIHLSENHESFSFLNRSINNSFLFSSFLLNFNIDGIDIILNTKKSLLLLNNKNTVLFPDRDILNSAYAEFTKEEINAINKLRQIINLL